MINILSTKKEETMALGTRLARLLKKGDIICLFGDLGSGKTTFTKGIAAGLNINQTLVNSPTFVLLNEYKGRLPLYHFDLYRLDKAGEILAIGYEEFLYGQGVSAIEWAEKLGPLLPQEYLEIKFLYEKNDKRSIQFLAHGKRAQEIMRRFKINP